MVKKETFVNKGTNAAALNAGIVLAIQDQINASQNDNIPHNALTIANQDATCTIFIFLDNISDHDKPDYILFPTQVITIDIREGVSFTTVFLKNTHASSNIAAKAIKYRISTIKEVGEIYTE